MIFCCFWINLCEIWLKKKQNKTNKKPIHRSHGTLHFFRPSPKRFLRQNNVQNFGSPLTFLLADLLLESWISTSSDWTLIMPIPTKSKSIDQDKYKSVCEKPRKSMLWSKSFCVLFNRISLFSRQGSAFKPSHPRCTKQPSPSPPHKHKHFCMPALQSVASCVTYFPNILTIGALVSSLHRAPRFTYCSVLRKVFLLNSTQNSASFMAQIRFFFRDMTEFFLDPRNSQRKYRRKQTLLSNWFSKQAVYMWQRLPNKVVQLSKTDSLK